MSDKSIAVIDDDERFRAALIELLQVEGYRTTGFGSAEEFLSCAGAALFNCIISDIHMPGITGIELKHRLTAGGIDVPVLMITGRKDSGLERLAISCGAIGLLTKPLESEILITSLEDVLGA